jgi:hypothetical protein
VSPGMDDQMLVGAEQFRRKNHALHADTRTHLGLEMNDVAGAVHGRS